MGRFDRILFATDGSDCAGKAFDTALDLATRYKSELIIVNVAEREDARPATNDDLARLRKNLAGRVEEFAQIARDKGCRRVRTVQTSGLPYSRILDTVDRDEPALIVVGATGWNADAGLGEVASHVSKFARCAVLIIR